MRIAQFTILLFWLVLIFSFISLEILLPIFDTRGETIWRKASHTKNLDKNDIDNFFLNGSFDPELGWDYSKPNISDTIKYIGHSYGDSFTESGHSGEKTWQQQFQELSNFGIINLGVGGYGLDQSILKFEKYSKKKTLKKVNNIILGLYGQVFSRSVSYYSYYYFFNSYFSFAFKPRFIKENDDFSLLKVPCQSSECLIEEITNINSDTFYNLNKNDFWYKKEISKPILKFPRTLSYIRAIPDIIQRKKQRNYLAPSYFEDESLIDLTKYLILRFSEASYKEDSNPIMLLMYDKFGLEGILKGKREDEWLIKFFSENNITYIDTSPFFIDYIKKKGTIKELFLTDGHFSFKGDSLVSLSIYKNVNKFKF